MMKAYEFTDMLRWIRYRLLLWRSRCSRRQQRQREFVAYLAELEDLTGQPLSPWQRSVMEDMYRESRLRKEKRLWGG